MDHSRTNPAYDKNKEVSVPVHQEGICTVQQRPSGELTVLWVGEQGYCTAYLTGFVALLVLLAQINQPTLYVVLNV